MLKPQNIGSFDQRIDIITPTEDDTSGERLITWDTGSPTYSNVYAKEIKSSGVEQAVEDQVVAKNRRSWVIRKFNYTINEEMAVYYDSKLYFIIAINSFRADRKHIVLECESRDNA